MLTTYPWHHKAWKRLHEMQQQNRLPHALLLCGNEGIGLKQFARAFAMDLLCLALNEEDRACGTCQSCQLFLAGSHPDINFIDPEEEGKQIKIAQVRELIEYVALKSFSGKKKISIIEPAEAMNRATANALLKTLEEPPEQSMLILLSHRPESMPITIRSRCQRIDFKPEFSNEALEWLKQQNIDSDIPIEYLLRLANGGPLKALQLVEDEQLQDRKTILMDLKNLSAPKVDPVQVAANWQSLGSDRVIGWLLRFLQDLIRLKLLKDKANLTNMDLKEDLQEIVKRLDLVQLVRNYDFVLQKYQQSTGPMNYNPLSILEEIIVNWNNPQIIN